MIGLHYRCLLGVNTVLPIADGYQRASYKGTNYYFDNFGNLIKQAFLVIILAIGLAGFGGYTIWIACNQGVLWRMVVFISAGAILAVLAPAISILLVYRVSHGNWGLISIGFSENVSTAIGIDASATCYRRAEDVWVSPIVVSELKLRDLNIAQPEAIRQGGRQPLNFVSPRGGKVFLSYVPPA